MSIRQFLKNLARPSMKRRRVVSGGTEVEAARVRKSAMSAGVHLTKGGVVPSAELEKAAALGRNSRGSD